MLFRYSNSVRLIANPVIWFLALIALIPLQANAHPMAPDLTVAQFRVHYKLIDVTLTGPASEFLAAAQVTEKQLNGDQTSKETLEKIAHWLPSAFMLQLRDNIKEEPSTEESQRGESQRGEKPQEDASATQGKTLVPEVVSADYLDAAQKNYASFRLQIHYATETPAQKLRLTSKFVHTIVSCSGVQFEMHGDKEIARNFETQSNLTSIWGNVQDFLLMGMEHLFTGTDHILFICTLIFALLEFKSVVKMLTGFTVGHSITLILSSLNVIHLDPRIADMGIALTIMYVGIENILSKNPPKHRFWLVTFFGLVHGMSFSSSLKEIGLPDQGLALCLLSFNLGIELAQIMIVAMVYPLLNYIRWRKEGLALHREDGTAEFRRLMNIGSGLTACMGLYWFVERFMSR